LNSYENETNSELQTVFCKPLVLIAVYRALSPKREIFLTLERPQLEDKCKCWCSTIFPWCKTFRMTL